MRDAFFLELADWFAGEPRAVFLTGDLGYKLFDPLRDIDPERVINVGVREAAMVGAAAGLAAGGRLPVTYSIVPFMTLRCLEFIKNDVCYHNLPVLLVGVGGGYAYGPNGPTHYGIDDLGVLSALPGITAYSPCDPDDVGAALHDWCRAPRPAYLRLGRNREPRLGLSSTREVSEPVRLRDGDAGTLVANGPVVTEALAAAERLAGEGHECRVLQVSCHTPFPGEAVGEALVSDAPVVSVEEHVATGGLGHWLRPWIPAGCRFRSLHAPAEFPHACLSRGAALTWAGIDADAVVAAFTELIAEESST